MARPRTFCTVEGCDRANYGHGYCHLHYYRLRREGTLERRGVQNCVQCGKPMPDTRRLGSLTCSPECTKRRSGSRALNLFRTYGITVADYDTLLAQQNGVCAICATDDPHTRWGVFHVDHDHTTDKVRGLLCANCNAGLGQFGDNLDRLRTAVAYMEATTL